MKVPKYGYSVVSVILLCAFFNQMYSVHKPIKRHVLRGKRNIPFNDYDPVRYINHGMEKNNKNMSVLTQPQKNIVPQPPLKRNKIILHGQDPNNPEQYAYSLNKTDTRSDFEGQSLFPKLKYHIGVLSTHQFLMSRARDLYHTWGKEATSSAIYIGKTQMTIENDLPVVQLQEVEDTVYPPQTKGFKMIKYWCDNLLHKYDWFIKVDDDTYVKVALLENFLWSLDQEKQYYIGRPGRGLPHEKHLLGLHGNTFCCGPTVIYSKTLLQDICPHIDKCLSEVKTQHEDTEIGRCIVNRLGVQCADNHKSVPNSRRLGKLFYQTYDRKHYMGDLSNHTIVTNAITLHEVKHSTDMYNLHYYYRLKMADHFTKSSHKSNPWKIIHVKAKLNEDKKQNHKMQRL